MPLQSCIRLVQFLFRIFKHVSEHRTGREVMPTKCIQRRCGLLIHTGTRSYSGASHLICIPSFRPNSVTFFTGCERGELLRDDVSDVPTVLHHSGLLQLPHEDVHRFRPVRVLVHRLRIGRLPDELGAETRKRTVKVWEVEGNVSAFSGALVEGLKEVFIKDLK